MSEPMTEAEQAAAKALARDFNLNHADGIQRLGPDSFVSEARAVVAAVEPHLAIAALERTVTSIEQFAARKRRAGHVRDAVGIDEAAELVLDELRTLRVRLSAALRTTTSEKES
jgi:hypothetical protein